MVRVLKETEKLVGRQARRTGLEIGDGQVGQRNALAVVAVEGSPVRFVRLGGGEHAERFAFGLNPCGGVLGGRRGHERVHDVEVRAGGIGDRRGEDRAAVVDDGFPHHPGGQIQLDDGGRRGRGQAQSGRAGDKQTMFLVLEAIMFSFLVDNDGRPERLDGGR